MTAPRMQFRLSPRPLTLCLVSSLALAACSNDFDADFRHLGGGLDTTDAAQMAAGPRPQPDARGVISYPNYQVAVARRGDTLTDIATRVGLPVDELAQYNGLPISYLARPDEVIALPRRVPDGGASGNDITAIAAGAIDRAGGGTRGTEPVRHKVGQGETAYTIARLYNVAPRDLGEWNGLGRDLTVREGQFLLIPVARQPGAASGGAVETTALPGSGSATPVPPSASQPLPPATAAAPAPAAPKPAAAASSKFLLPIDGNILRNFQQTGKKGLDIEASAGTAVRAASDGSVALISRNVEGVPILLISHGNNLHSVYIGISDISVKKGDKIARGQPVAKVAKADPAFLHFEIRRGLESVDPGPFLQ